MSTRRRAIHEEAWKIVEPIAAELGLELVDIELSGRDRERVLCLYLDREGGISVDELKKASQAVEKTLEISEIIRGRYRLEVSSPGIDRPLKRPRDYRSRLGSRIKVKTFAPLEGGRRVLTGLLASTGEDGITLSLDDGTDLTLTYEAIASARPEVDWEELLKGTDGRRGSISPRGGPHEP